MIEKTITPMAEDTFWDLVHLSLEKTDSRMDQEAFLEEEINNFTPEELAAFYLRAKELETAIDTSTMRTVGYSMNRGIAPDDDEMVEFLYWVITRGKAVYDKAKEDPATLEGLVDPIVYYDYHYRVENLASTASQTFYYQTEKSIFDFI